MSDPTPTPETLIAQWRDEADDPWLDSLLVKMLRAHADQLEAALQSTNERNNVCLTEAVKLLTQRKS